MRDERDVLDAGRLVVLSDPTGAVFCAWQPQGHRGAQLVNEPGGGAGPSSKLATPNGSRAFYEAVFGWDTDTFETGAGEFTMWRVKATRAGSPGTWRALFAVSKVLV